MTPMYGSNSNFKLVLFIIIGISLVITSIFITVNGIELSKDKVETEQSTSENVNDLTAKENAEVDITSDDIVSGKKVIATYKEFLDKDIAILVATSEFLEQDKEELLGDEEYPYIRYVLSKSDEKVAESILDSAGRTVPLTYINYNAVLNDTCLFQRASDSIYETNNGFAIDYNEEGQGVLYHPLIQNNKKTIYSINEEATFLSKVIYNSEGKLIGYAFLEKRS